MHRGIARDQHGKTPAALNSLDLPRCRKALKFNVHPVKLKGARLPHCPAAVQGERVAAAAANRDNIGRERVDERGRVAVVQVTKAKLAAAI